MTSSQQSEGEDEHKIDSSYNGSLDFDPQSFVNVGSWLSAQERLAVDSAATQTIASPTRSIASSTTSTESSSDSEKSGSKISKKKRKLGLMGLLSVVALLCGTNVYSWRQSQAWKSHNSVLEARVAELEALNKGGRNPAPYTTPLVDNRGCPAEIVDTCWFKVGLGNCAKDMWVDPIGAAEGAWRNAWNVASGTVGAFGDAVTDDFHKLGKELQGFGSAVMNFLNEACHGGSGSNP